MATLSEKRVAFVREYLVDLNATQAAIRAGYSPRSAASTGERLLRNAEIREAIQQAQRERACRLDVTADGVVRELARIGLSDVRNYVEWGPNGVILRESATLSEDAARAVAEVVQTTNESGVNVRVKLHPKVAALDRLGRHLNLFKEREPLEALLAALPAELGQRVRAELGRILLGTGGTASSADPAAGLGSG